MSAFAWALVAAVIWGIVPLIEKIGLSGGDPTVALFARSFGIVAGIVIFGLIWSPWRGLGQLNTRSFALLALSGLLASFLGQLAFYHALRHGPVSQVTPVAGTYPLVAAVLSWLVLREPVTVPRLLGAGFVVVGALLLRR